MEYTNILEKQQQLKNNNNNSTEMKKKSKINTNSIETLFMR